MILPTERLYVFVFIGLAVNFCVFPYPENVISCYSQIKTSYKREAKKGPWD